MADSRTLLIIATLAALVGVALNNTQTTAATNATDRILRGESARNTEVKGSDDRKPLTPTRRRDQMNKKQLANLVAAIVIAANKHANTTMETTEDEARTLVGMALRKQANQLVCDASGCDADEAKVLLKDAQTEVADAIAQKKADKADKATADAE